MTTNLPPRTKTPATAGPASAADGADNDPARPAPSAAAKRALAEADERRRKLKADECTVTDVSQTEVGGREGPDPIRYGDWEKGGIASDF